MALLASCVALGTYLRATQLPSQILVDDEWHAVHALLHLDARAIATNFGTADYSIPLTLYDRFLALHGGLSEWQMHVPPLVAGIALLVVAHGYAALTVEIRNRDRALRGEERDVPPPGIGEQDGISEQDRIAASLPLDEAEPSLDLVGRERILASCFNDRPRELLRPARKRHLRSSLDGGAQHAGRLDGGHR